MSQTPSQPPQPPGIRVSVGEVINLFHDIYYQVGQTERGTWTQTYWMGVRTEKYPADLWIYQEILFAVRPQLIVETGTRHGGSALFLCHMLDILGGDAQLVSIDIEPSNTRPQHARLTYLTGSSIDPAIVQQVRDYAAGKSSVLVILDSDHRRDHVLAEMRAYHDLVTPGNYMIVEDTNVNGHPVFPQHGPGPMEAVEQFMCENQDFQIDKRCEKFLVTANPSGFLRRRDTMR
jgi:cephalosporin hydroxylase